MRKNERQGGERGRKKIKERDREIMRKRQTHNDGRGWMGERERDCKKKGMRQRARERL